MGSKSKQKMFKSKIKKVVLANKIVALLLTAAILSLGTVGYKVKADSYDDQINALSQQNGGLQAQSNSLAAVASSYQDAIDQLQGQIDALQQNIVATQQKSDEVKTQITQAEAELAQEKQTLGENIKTMYLEGQISTLEILASSNDISDYVNKEQYRNAVEDKVKSSVDKITALKVQLEQQQRELQGLLNDLQNQQNQLAAKQAEQSSMLAYTEGQKSAYDSQIRNNNSQIATLRAAQAAANRRLSGGAAVIAGDPNHGGYPSNWANSAQDTIIDSWGMYNRECVSYTAWKVFQNFGYMPYWGGSGNANQWPGDAQAAGIPTGYTPRVHSVAISLSGAFGHAMWVEGVSGNTIHVSQYNYDLAGHYSEMTINGSGLIYIYFGG